MRASAVRCRPDATPRDPSVRPRVPRRRSPAARRAPRCPARRRAEPARCVRGARRRARGGRGAAHARRLGRRRNPRRRGRRLPARDAARRHDLGAERLGRGAGHAVEQAEDVRDLYAAGGGALGRGGPHVPLHGRARRAMRLSSTPGSASASASSTSTRSARLPTTPLTQVPDGVEIRRPTRDDIDILSELELALPAHQQLSPVFSSLPPQTFEEVRRRVGRGLRQPGVRHLRRRRRRAASSAPPSAAR